MPDLTQANPKLKVWALLLTTALLKPAGEFLRKFLHKHIPSITILITSQWFPRGI